MELLDSEYAAGWSEVEAKLAEGRYADTDVNVSPHNLTLARRELLKAGLVVETSATTRGGTAIDLLTPVDTRRRKTRTDEASARKRLLLARYHGWATGDHTYPRGRIGPAGENVTRKSVLEAATLSMTEPHGGEVRTFLGLRLTGPLDSAGHLPLILPNGRPGPTIAVPIEVKNVRDWLYPQAREIYQLLYKSAILQQHAPEVPIVPVLVCRRAHLTLIFMASQLGFRVLATERQYIYNVDSIKLNEVRTELGFLDLTEQVDADDRVVRWFRQSLPKKTLESAAKWRTTVLDLGWTDKFRQLSQPMSVQTRARLVDRLRDEAKAADLPGGW